MAQISVLMNVYNVEAFVAAAVASIQTQTFSDTEIVIVDDGSTDGTRRTVEQIASEDSRVKVVGTVENRGIPHALNLGLEHCSAPFIAKMDGDDIALPARLEGQLRFLRENPEIALVGCATTAIDKSGKPIPGLGISRRPTSQESVAKTMLLSPPCLHVWLARREVYDTLSGYRVMAFAEDYDFLLRAVTSGFRLSNLPEALMQIRTRSGKATFRVEVRKAHHYVVGLCRERLRRGKDSFSREGYLRSVKSGSIEGGAFLLAMKFAQTGFRCRNRALRYCFLALSAAVSPWQARYFVDRLRFRIAMHVSALIVILLRLSNFV